MIGRREKTKEPFGRLPDRNAAQPLLQESSSEKKEAGEEWKGSEGAHSSQGICSSANYSRCGGNNRGASESCPSLHLKWPRTRRGAEPFGHDAHPEEGEVEMATETQAIPVVVPTENAPDETHPEKNVEAPNPEEESPSVASSGGNSVNDAACTSASPFSYAELEDKLKQIPPGLTTVMPSAKMFEMVESVYCFFASLSL